MINSSSQAKKVCLENFLLEVKKPARYIGGEINSIIKQISDSDIHFALCFPDAYEIGMSHLGIKILYNILNKQEDVWAQRCFTPWPDMEEKLRSYNIGLFGLEGQQEIKNFDIVGFSLQYELCYTNVLCMLELAGIPLHAQDRDAHPLIIAGGPCTCNPEPMAEFIDAFFIGEAEDSILEFINIYRNFKKQNPLRPLTAKDQVRSYRQELLHRISAIEGIYVPRFYKPEDDIKMFSQIIPADAGFPTIIKRRYVADLDDTDFFTKPPVPFIEIVHDRIVLEIMRGCPNRCFFCQAGHTINPVRVRSVDKLLNLARQTYEFTGYDDVSFCALSSASYPYLSELISQLHVFCKEKGLGISLPSLRIDKDFISLISLIGDLKKTGLTFAPEAGSERLRKFINKEINMDNLKEAILESYRRGWRKLKLYFMIGLPTETEQDLIEIANLIDECSALRKQICNKRGKINVGISNFIPKPHTPFEYLNMDSMESLLKKQNFLRARLKKRYLDVRFHDVPMSFIEASLSRGSRILSSVIERAYLKGARFDGWSQMFNFEIWESAFTEAGVDPKEWVYQKHRQDARLTWGHIGSGLEKVILKRDFQNI